MALHKDITGADLHEPKGVATATSGQVYQADGAGSGTWSTLALPTGTFKVTKVDFTSTGTWTKPANLFGIYFHIVGGGGGNTASNGGTTSVGTLAVVNGGTGGNAPGAGGTVGTTPSGAIGYAGNAGLTNTTMTSAAGATGLTLPPGIPALYKKGCGGYDAATPIIGGSGAYMSGWIATASLGATETITIGAAGDSGATAGYCLIEQFITV